AGKVVVSPAGDQVYVARAVFARDAATGALAFVTTVPPGTFPGTTISAVTSDGRDLYAAADWLRVLERGFSGCEATPAAGCRVAPRGSLTMSHGARDAVSWRWLNGEATTIEEL